MNAKVLQFPASTTTAAPAADGLVSHLERLRDGARFVTEDEQRAQREEWDQAQWTDRLRSSGIWAELDDDAKRSTIRNQYELEVGTDGKPLPIARVRPWYAKRHPMSPDEKPGGPSWLFMCGPKGCGKSTAAAYVLARQWGLYVTMTTLLADFVSWKHAKPAERHTSMWERYKRAGTLVLDEVGTEKDSDAESAREVIFALANARQSKRMDTVVLTNLSKQMLVERIRSGVYDERTHDRLRGLALVVGFEGGSLRRTLTPLPRTATSASWSRERRELTRSRGARQRGGEERNACAWGTRRRGDEQAQPQSRARASTPVGIHRDRRGSRCMAPGGVGRRRRADRWAKRGNVRKGPWRPGNGASVTNKPTQTRARARGNGTTERTVWTPDRVARVCKRHADGAWLKHACALEGGTYDGLIDAAGKEPEIRAAVDAAHATRTMELQRLKAEAFPGSDDWKKYAWDLERWDRETFAPPKQSVESKAEITGKDGTPLVRPAQTPEERAAALEELMQFVAAVDEGVRRVRDGR